MMESQPLQDPTAEADGGPADPAGAPPAVICPGEFRSYQEDVGNDTAVGDPTPYDDWFDIDELFNQVGNPILNAPADTMPHEVVPQGADNTNQLKLLVSAAYQGDSMLVNSESHGFSTADQLSDAINTNAGWMSEVQVLGLLNNVYIFQLEDATELCDSSDRMRRFGAVVTVSQSHLVGLPISHKLYSSTGRILKEHGPKILKISGNSISRFVLKGNLWKRRRYTIDNTYHVLEWLPKPRDNQMSEFNDNRSGSASATQDIELVNAEKEEGKGKLGKEKGDNKRKEMASRSKVWDHFEKVIVGGILKGKCKYCSSEIKAESVANGTSALHNHFNICKRNPYKNKDSKQGRAHAYGRTSDHYPSASVIGVRHHAAQMTLEAQEEVAALLNRLDMGVEISPFDNRSAWQHLNGKLRKIYETLTCARASDVTTRWSSRHAHRPPRHSSSSWQPPPQVQPRPPLSTQAGGSSWHHQPQSSPQPTPPLLTQTGGSSWHQQPYSTPHPAPPVPIQAGGSSWQQQPYSTPQPAPPLPTQAGGSYWYNPQSVMVHATGDTIPVLAFADAVDYGDVWSQADVSGLISHFPGFQTPPSPPTQVMQSLSRQPDELIYSRGHRQPQPTQPLTLSGPRKRPRRRTRRAAAPTAPQGGPGGADQGDEQD